MTMTVNIDDTIRNRISSYSMKNDISEPEAILHLLSFALDTLMSKEDIKRTSPLEDAISGSELKLRLHEELKKRFA